MSYVVLEHQLDEAAGAYRIVIGLPVYETVNTGIDDEKREPTYEEILVGYDMVEDFLFAADDDRWRTAKGRPLAPDVLAGKQREIVLAVLADRDTKAEADAAAAPVPLSMPGVGDVL